MSRRVFQPIVSVFLEATAPVHDESIQYKLSYGYENDFQEDVVFKVQMVGNKKIKGRQAPSYPEGDFEKIVEIQKLLKQELDKMDKRLRDVILTIEELEE